MPLFIFTFEKVEYEEQDCSEEDLIRFMRHILDKMQLANECIVISLIYLEKMMLTGKIEIRNINWRPLLFTALLLASKFWEDVNLWNIDYAEEIELYPLKSINRMESEFLSLCDYNIYVSADLYSRYQTKVRELSNPILGNTGPKNSRLSHFNRFKQGGASQNP
mmetsp:Transcript_13081/g.9123  ORF Transcript_13081/g.9123 Transcript_13081/m.9123 type:complete len:164 (-) Transcript_13081:387-878(-)|eukprot:CAMPEP_0116885316 /NCGR_PEP_ID=MMETSP0463-20121206/18607_1 /TAXON_ID=181622 /ORGANISM="Strombidinopsis sp, Strain SopsisLIS2011" /LENGTH=163 /DNA_ID=CAMNT_0004543497 /DNA_START=932 /DNA_END=1423 /DNA_ORIENTATION=+